MKDKKAYYTMNFTGTWTLKWPQARIGQIIKDENKIPWTSKRQNTEAENEKQLLGGTNCSVILTVGRRARKNFYRNIKDVQYWKIQKIP